MTEILSNYDWYCFVWVRGKINDWRMKCSENWTYVHLFHLNHLHQGILKSFLLLCLFWWVWTERERERREREREEREKEREREMEQAHQTWKYAVGCSNITQLLLYNKTFEFLMISLVSFLGINIFPHNLFSVCWLIKDLLCKSLADSKAIQIGFVSLTRVPEISWSMIAISFLTS